MAAMEAASLLEMGKASAEAKIIAPRFASLPN